MSRDKCVFFCHLPITCLQVVSLQVRSNLLEGDGVMVPEGSTAHARNGDKTKELPYMVMLNRNLPQDIRVTGWTTVNPGFSARFDCQGRTYKYFFPLGQMDIEVSLCVCVCVCVCVCGVSRLVELVSGSGKKGGKGWVKKVVGQNLGQF